MVIKWTVMKNRKAYENTLSIILDEPDIKMEEVKVEQVIFHYSPFDNHIDLLLNCIFDY